MTRRQLRQELKRKGVGSIAATAKAIDVTAAHLSNYLAGRDELSVAKLLAFVAHLKALGIPASLEDLAKTRASRKLRRRATAAEVRP